MVVPCAASPGSQLHQSASNPERDELLVQIIRSDRRKKTISAKLINWYTVEIRAPADLPQEDLDHAVDELVQRMLIKRSRYRRFRSDEDLERRASACNQTYFDGSLRWQSIRFVSNQNRRFGSCSPARGTIRISDRLAGAPDFVLDYVVIHELAHMLEPNHSERFWELVGRFDKAERARGYLMALSLEEDMVADA